MQWYGREGAGLQHAVTMGFTALALAQVFHAANARSQSRSAFIRPFTNIWLWAALLVCLILQVLAVYWPPLQIVLHTVPLTATDVVVVVACSLAPVAVVEVLKLARKPSAVS
jgi:Ca2+-transporting ATPase